ncbi:hypothetical protein EJ419_05585 [Alloscardovia theropitheci]|uniref:N-acetyltransferase domain-containing protein n=1 Tax=Alloscardovia theropitheci TaxID=2496842 RepID=A0A4R0QPH7_9BIFI|nr:hypothetical protein [Alloscardovia theropitheci]TCD54123.1 hypothetical protein EJ419_05585 [Alloscardovia theropitheci]
MNMSMDSIQLVPFSSVNLQDSFFDSLRDSYPGFDAWFERKAQAHHKAYVSFDRNHVIGFLYIKDENDIDNTITPHLTRPRLKIGTFKVDFNHHSALGKRLLAIALRNFVRGHYEYMYVTLFNVSSTQGLQNLLRQYGFVYQAEKGQEQVWFKRTMRKFVNPYASYPYIFLNRGYNRYLPIYPEYHQRMFATRLATEKNVPIADVIPINSIEKIYLSGMPIVQHYRMGDHLVIYRTKDKYSPAYFTSVVTGVCTIVDVKNLSDFSSFAEFLSFIKNRSVFTDTELEDFWNSKKYPYLIVMVENVPFTTPYPTREKLLETGLLTDCRVQDQSLSDEQFRSLLSLGGINEGFIID